MTQRIKKALLYVLLIYVALVGALYLAQRSMIFFPAKDAPDISPYAAEGVQEVSVETADGLTLTSWFKPPEAGKDILVFFHGNASSHLGNVYMAAPYARDGYGFLSVGYRGYNGNPGKPSEQGFYEDARATLKALMDSGAAAENIVLYGQSIGTGVAVQMAREFPDVKALILESPYTSLPDVAAGTYFFVPVRLLMKDKFDNLSKIQDIQTPLLVIQGLRDSVIPPKFGRRLYEAANEPKDIIQLEGYGHNDLPVEDMAASVIDFIEAL
jgi:hypothetical protein